MHNTVIGGGEWPLSSASAVLHCGGGGGGGGIGAELQGALGCETLTTAARPGIRFGADDRSVEPSQSLR